MYDSEMKKVDAALAIVRDSKRLLVNLEISITSLSSGHNLVGHGLVPYLKATKRTLRVRLFLLAIRSLWYMASRRPWET